MRMNGSRLNHVRLRHSLMMRQRRRGMRMNGRGLGCLPLRHVRMRHTRLKRLRDCPWRLDRCGRRSDNGNPGPNAHKEALNNRSPRGRDRKAQQLGRKTRRSDATGCDGESRPVAETIPPNPLQVAELGDGVRSHASESESTPDRIRTCDLRIRSQRFRFLAACRIAPHIVVLSRYS